MPAIATETDVITRTMQIAANPETVFAFFADQEKLGQWMGRRVQADPRPGGLLRVDYNGFDIMRGSFVELVPFSRVVWTWGWESLSPVDTGPGSSTVEFTFEPAGSGTLLTVRHAGLKGSELKTHAEGWDACLGVLPSAVAGNSESPFLALKLSEPDEYASQLNTKLIRLLEVIGACSEAQWRTPVAGDGRTLAVVAAHIGAHLALAGFVASTAKGERSPLADAPAEAIDQMNAAAATADGSISPAEVIARVRESGPSAVATLRALDSAALGHTQPMAFAGGAELSAAAIAQGPLLGDIESHLASIEAALKG